MRRLTFYGLLTTVYGQLPGCIGPGDGLKLTSVSDAKFLLVALTVVVALVAAALLLRRARRGGGPMLGQPQALAGMKGSHDAAQERSIGVALGREILPLLEQGKFEEAADVVSARTGWGREESLASVKRLELLMKRLGM